MNISENEAAMRKARKEKLISAYRKAIENLNAIENRLLAGGLTGKENDEWLTARRNLIVRIVNLEYKLKNDFGIDIERL